VNTGPRRGFCLLSPVPFPSSSLGSIPAPPPLSSDDIVCMSSWRSLPAAVGLVRELQVARVGGKIMARGIQSNI
jgi:hypothetical protein